MARASSTGDTATPRAGAGPVAWLALVCSLAGLGLGAYAAFRGGRGGGGSTAAPADLEARLDRNASDLRASLQDDFKHQVAESKDVLARAERRFEEAVATATKKADDSKRVAEDAQRTSADTVASVEGKVRDVAQAQGDLKTSLDSLSVTVKEIGSRPVVVAAAAGAPAAPNAKPIEEPKVPDPLADQKAPAGPTPEQIAANKEKVKAWIADLASPDLQKAFVASASLGGTGDLTATEPLVKAMKEHKDSMVRASAAEALGKLHACDAVPALLEAFLDRDGGVVLAAGLAFRKIAAQDSGLTGSPTKREKTDARDKWLKWWSEHEKEVRERLGQPKSAPAPAGDAK